MSRRSNAFTVAVLDLPSWADYTALPPGTFREFTLNTPGDVGMQRATLHNWCGGAFVPDFGVRGAVGYAGGGEHSNWTDSSLTGPGQQGAYVLDCDTRLYSRKCYPAANHTGVVGTGGGGSPTDDWGAYNDDGSPQAKHTYNCMSYMPAAWGGGASGSLMRVAHTGGVSISRGPLPGGGAHEPGLAATWRYDLSKAAHTLADPSTIKLTGSSVYNYGVANDAQGRPGATINDASFACIDMTREGWWSTHRGGSGWGQRMAFTSKAGVITGPQGQAHGFTNYAALHHFADDDIVVSLTDLAVGGEWVWQVWIWQAGTSNAWVQNTNVTRQTITDEYSPGLKAYPQIGEQLPRWSSILGCFVGFDPWYPYGVQPTTTVRVWKITPPAAGQRFTGQWQITWELVQAKAGTESTNFMNMLAGNAATDAGAANSVYGRFVECPSLRAFVWTRDTSKPGQLVRLKGM